jgi:hypothetical protein
MTKLNININPIDYDLEMKLANAVLIKGNYKKLNDKQIDKLNRYIIKKKLSLQIEDILSIRSAHMTIKIMKNSYRLKKLINEIYKLYENNISLKEITNKYDLPPIPLIKNILYKKKYSKDIVKGFFYGKKLNKLSDFDLEQLNYAIENDIFNKVVQTEQIENSENFEKAIGNFLKKHNVKFKTQDELVKEQTEKYGRPVNTPDFLILSDFYINDQKINWIDAKNFYGANTFLVKKKIKKQVKKYINEYGFGSIFFSLHFSEKLKFDNVLLVNYNIT